MRRVPLVGTKGAVTMCCATTEAVQDGCWDEQLVGRMVRAAVDRKLGMFVHYQDLGPEDLAQEVIAAIRRAFPTFDPAKSSFSTWVGMLAGRRLIDIWRKRARLATREGVYAAQRPTVVGPAHAADDTDPDDDLSLPDWLAQVYVLAKRTFTAARYRQGRRFWNVAQVVAVGLLIESRGLSLRQARALFIDRPDCRRAVRFLHVPGHHWFQGAREVGTDFLKKSARKNRAAEARREAEARAAATGGE